MHNYYLDFLFTLDTKIVSCSTLAAISKPSPIFKILIVLGDGYDSTGSLQWRSSGSDCFGYFPTSYMKNNCMNSLNFKKNVWCNKIWKATYVNALIHHHVLQWFFPIHINRHIGK